MPERGRKGVAIDRKTGVSKQPMKRLGNEEKELPKKGGQAGGGIVVRARYSRKVNCKQGNRKLLLWGEEGETWTACPWKLLLALLPHIGVTQYFLLPNRVTSHGV